MPPIPDAVLPNPAVDVRVIQMLDPELTIGSEAIGPGFANPPPFVPNGLHAPPTHGVKW